mmetsp:Transcript_102310/g.295979  ORF Transcript_102310/g.295979 Transcript_102310/m.295979 type:complete len:123 (-) Transcript_102310:280-648(-)
MGPGANLQYLSPAGGRLLPDGAEVGEDSAHLPTGTHSFAGDMVQKPCVAEQLPCKAIWVMMVPPDSEHQPARVASVVQDEPAAMSPGWALAIGASHLAFAVSVVHEVPRNSKQTDCPEKGCL